MIVLTYYIISIKVQGIHRANIKYTMKFKFNLKALVGLYILCSAGYNKFKSDSLFLNENKIALRKLYKILFLNSKMIVSLLQ